MGAYLQARAQGGEWLLRLEDLDRPRVVPGAADRILRSLEAHGLYWDGPVLRQGQRDSIYQSALEQLTRDQAVYYCGCSRKQLRDTGLAPGVYPGTCRGNLRPGPGKQAIRIRVEADWLAFEDGLQGRFAQHLAREVGDFVIRRRDGLFAYQLAVVVDDAEQGISEVVRGSDLLSSTPRQIYLQGLLHLPRVRYAHLPVVLNEQGNKLSKQTFAAPLDDSRPLPAIWQALRFLGQNPPGELLRTDLATLWAWAENHWRLSAVPKADRPYSETISTFTSLPPLPLA